ncbi:MAG TPA: hypothetical protein EYP85_17060 [Armatimonadetes bacterium]|nr:hypothetical protein [Armatimonadota bacterium]
MLRWVDVAIIVLYIAGMMAIGVAVRRRAARGIDSYFLGERQMPWWMLAMSGSSSYWDITGTMWIVSLLCLMGMKAMWHQWIWGFPLPVFFAAYMGKWINRSKVITAAEWMRTRFGDGEGGEAARLAYAILAIVTVSGFLAYAAVGMGKFGEQYLPWPRSVCAAVILACTGAYIITGGFHSVILTEFVQTIIMSLGALIICGIGFSQVSLADLRASVPPDFFSLQVHWREPGLRETEFFLFGALTLAWVMKGLLLCLGGPEQLYDFQRFLSAKNPRDACKLGALWGALHTLRWPMAMAIAGLALVGFKGVTDPEAVLPLVIREFLPVGVRGLVLAALLAAFMSTFNSTVNAGASYLVRDIYQKYFNPQASPRQLVYAGYISSTALILLGILIGATAKSIHQVFMWIMAALGAGVLLPNFLRWYWWRLNGWGFTVGVLTGIGCSLVQAVFFGQTPLYIYFPVIAVIGLVAAVVTSYLTEPTDEEVLVNFYLSVQPAGLWGPIVEKAKAQRPEFAKDVPFWQDFVNVILGVPWLWCLWMLPMYWVAHRVGEAWLCAGVVALLTVVLYFTWYRNLGAVRE